MLYAFLGGVAVLYAIGKPRWTLVYIVLLCLIDEVLL